MNVRSYPCVVAIWVTLFVSCVCVYLYFSNVLYHLSNQKICNAATFIFFLNLQICKLKASREKYFQPRKKLPMSLKAQNVGSVPPCWACGPLPERQYTVGHANKDSEWHLSTLIPSSCVCTDGWSGVIFLALQSGENRHVRLFAQLLPWVLVHLILFYFSFCTHINNH